MINLLKPIFFIVYVFVSTDLLSQQIIKDTEIQIMINKLNSLFFKKNCPKNITVKYAKLENSGAIIDTNKNIITLSNNYLSNKSRLERPIYEYKNQEELLAHEISHLCLSVLTKKNNMKEEFRFFDEGFAEIMGRQIAEPQEVIRYKKYAITIAKNQIKTQHISFKKIQKWNNYFGDFNNTNLKNWYAYDVGASFIFFILDKYSQDKLYKFFSSVSKTKNLSVSIFIAFGKIDAEFEKEWIEYIQKH